MRDPRFECVLDAKATLGEGPVWLPGERRLGWIDIHAGRLHRFDPATGTDAFTELGEPIGSFAPRASGGSVAALKSGFWLLDAEGRRIRHLADPLAGRAHLRMNDGRCDRQGRFRAGAIDESGTRRDADLYRLEIMEDGQARCDAQLSGLTISNGLAFSPDGRTMYHADTPTRTVRAFDHDPATGAITDPRVLHRFARGEGHPDGAAVDAEGGYWVALWGAGKVVRIAPEGGITAELSLPARCPTMPAFGGDDFRTLFVTTARVDRPADELDALPRSGGIFAMRMDVAGLPETPFPG